MMRTVCVVLTVLIALSSVAFACKCGVSSREAVIASTPVVFEGRITNIQTRGTAQVTTFSVVRAVKGAVGTTMKVKSHTKSAACGYDFRDVEKKTLTVGGAGGGGTVSVRRCTMFNLNGEN